MKPLISIVLPTYNRASMLGGALESCLAQTWRELELIVVDDGSRDNTGEVVRAYAERDPRVRYVRQENGRIPRALNRGFREARGELFTWTSDDNLYEPDALALMAECLLAHPEAGLVYCDCKAIDESGAVIGSLPHGEPEQILETNVVGACFLYRRSTAEQVGEYDPDAFLAEDYDYWLRISRVAPLLHLTGVTPYLYRLHPDSLTSRREADAELMAARIRARYVDGSRRRATLADGYCRAAQELRRVGRYGEAARHYVAAIRLRPGHRPAYLGLLASCARHSPRRAGA